MCIEIGMACAMDTGNPAPVRAATHAVPRLIEAAAVCGEQVLLRAQQQLLRSSLSEHGMLVVRNGVLSIDTKLVKSRADSRAENCVASLQFANPKHCFSLQASHLLACLAVKALADRPGSKLAAPVWPKALAGLPGPAADSICKFWDKTRIDRYLDSVVWDTPEKRRRIVHRQKT